LYLFYFYFCYFFSFWGSSFIFNRFCFLFILFIFSYHREFTFLALNFIFHLRFNFFFDHHWCFIFSSRFFGGRIQDWILLIVRYYIVKVNFVRLIIFKFFFSVTFFCLHSFRDDSMYLNVLRFHGFLEHKLQLEIRCCSEICVWMKGCDMASDFE